MILIYSPTHSFIHSATRTLPSTHPATRSLSHLLTNPLTYHWRQLPQVKFLLRQNTSFVPTNVCLPRQKKLSRQNYVCRDKIFWLRQAYFCRDKHVFFATKLLSRQKLYMWQLPPMMLITHLPTRSLTDSLAVCFPYLAE